METINLEDLSNLELPLTRESLVSQLDHVIRSSSDVHAYLERITVETGEYVVLLRGVLKTEPAAEVDASEIPAEPFEPNPDESEEMEPIPDASDEPAAAREDARDVA